MIKYKYKYTNTNTNTQIQIQIRTHKYKYKYRGAPKSNFDLWPEKKDFRKTAISLDPASDSFLYFTNHQNLKALIIGPVRLL